MEGILPGLRESSVVTEVAVPGKDVGQISRLPVLFVLHDGVQSPRPADLKLGLAEPGDLHHHVEGGEAGLVSEQRDVVPRRHQLAVLLLEVDEVLLAGLRGVFLAPLHQSEAQRAGQHGQASEEVC